MSTMAEDTLEGEEDRKPLSAEKLVGSDRWGKNWSSLRLSYFTRERSFDMLHVLVVS